MVIAARKSKCSSNYARAAEGTSAQAPQKAVFLMAERKIFLGA